MPEILPSDALRLAINVLRDVAESRKMPSGLTVDQDAVDLHANAADELETTLNALRQQE